MSGSMTGGDAAPNGFATLTTSAMGSALTQILMADDIVPGSDPSYQTCKLLYLYHPIGAKMAEAPLNMAQSQQRNIEVAGAPEGVAKAFEREWNAVGADGIINNTMKLARVYGIASVVIGVVGMPSNEPLPPEALAKEQLFFNVLDPLNTSGSLVLNQDPNSPDFQKASSVTSQGQTYHRSRCCVVMNEEPVYIAFTTSAFGYVGRSIYQRALFPMKSFIESMRADDMIVRKAGVVVAKMKQPGSIFTGGMARVMGYKRQLLKEAKTDNVLGIDIDENIETLNMQNIDGAGTYARTNILKNIATAADMPAKLLENETLVQGFGEGQEDAKLIARYVERVRIQMKPLYDFFDTIVQLRAWNSDFYEEIQKTYPDTYGKVKYEAALSRWQNKFSATWPNVMMEPESERVKTDDVKLRAILGVVQTFLPIVDPENKSRLIEWATDNIADTELLLSVPLTLDMDALREWDQQQQEMQQQMQQAAMEGGEGGGGGAPGGKPGGPPGQPGVQKGNTAKNIMSFNMRSRVGG